MIKQLKNCVFDIEDRPELKDAIVHRLKELGVDTFAARKRSARLIKTRVDDKNTFVLAHINYVGTLSDAVNEGYLLMTLSELYDLEPEKHTISIDGGEAVEIPADCWRHFQDWLEDVK